MPTTTPSRPGGLTATVTGGGRLYVPALAPANAATVQVVVVNPPIVAQWAENQYEVAEGEDENETATLTLKTAAGRAEAAGGRTRSRCSPRTIPRWTADDFTAVDVELTVRPGDWTGDGAVFAVSVPVTVETLQDLVLEGEERFRLQVSAADQSGSARDRVPRRSPRTWAARGDARPRSSSTTTRPCR